MQNKIIMPRKHALHETEYYAWHVLLVIEKIDTGCGGFLQSGLALGRVDIYVA
jgi:hypothetical protein